MCGLCFCFIKMPLSQLTNFFSSCFHPCAGLAEEGTHRAAWQAPGSQPRRPHHTNIRAKLGVQAWGEIERFTTAWRVLGLFFLDLFEFLTPVVNGLVVLVLPAGECSL